MENVFLNRRFAAKFLRQNLGVRCSEKLLRKLAEKGEGPPFFDDGESVWYSSRTLEAWVRETYSRYQTSELERRNLRDARFRKNIDADEIDNADRAPIGVFDINPTPLISTIERQSSEKPKQTPAKD
jgi:hypothetical protein